MTRVEYFALIAFSILALAGCKTIDPPEKIPSYIRIQSFKFPVDTPIQGTGSSKLTDVWVDAGGSFLGAFQLPVTIPVLKSGTQTLTIKAGVMENGISSTRSPYPFLTPYIIDENLVEGKVDTIVPEFRYSTSTKFILMENFEGTQSNFELTPKSTVPFSIAKSKDSVFEGSGALKALFPAGTQLFECVSKDYYDLPRAKAVWLEMNYKCSVPFEVGLFSIGSSDVTQIPAGGVNASAKWNKIYINLTSVVSSQDLNRVFKLYIGTALNNAAADDYILVDNLKILSL